MSHGRYNSSLTRVQPFFDQPLVISRTGAAWLPGLLAAAPRSSTVLGKLLDEPSTLLTPLLGPHPSGTALRVQIPGSDGLPGVVH